MNVVFYKTEKVNLKEEILHFNPNNILPVKEGILKGVSSSLSNAMDQIHNLEFDLIENSLREVTIRSANFEETFKGESAMEVIMELTVFHFNFNQEDILPVEFELKGVLKNKKHCGFYLLNELKEPDSLYKGIEFGEEMYFYFKRSSQEEILIETSCGSIKRRTVI